MPNDLDMFNDDLDDVLNEPDKEEKEEKEEKEDGPDNEGEVDDESESDDEKEGKDDEDEKDEDEETKPVKFSPWGENEDEDAELAEAAPVDLAQFTKKYPKVFEEFPNLKPALIREQKFTEVFPTIELAQEAYDRSESFKNFEAEIFSGQPKNLLGHIARSDQKAFSKFADNILPAIRQISPDQFNAIVSDEFKKVIQYVASQAKKHGDENLGKAAQFFSGYLFDDIDPQNLKLREQSKDDQDSDERVKFNNERQRFLKERYEVALEDVSVQVDRKLTSAIAKDLDPNSRLSEFHRKAIVEQVIKDVYNMLNKDERHGRSMRALWERSAKASHSAEWRNKIRDTYLAAALRIMPNIRTKRKDEALKSLKPGKVNNDKLSAGKAASSSKSNGTGDRSSKGGRQIDYSRTSDEDLFNDKVTYRK